MENLRHPFDPRAFELLRRVEADPDAASEVLALAAKYLHERRSMPPELADYIADAFMVAAKQPRDRRVKALSDWLNLTANNRRKVRPDWLDAYDVIKANPLATKNAAAEALKKQTGIGKTKADELIAEAAKYIKSEE